MNKTKEEIIDEILTNSVYQADSQLIINLKKALNKLSKPDLSNLMLIIQLNCSKMFGQVRPFDQ